MKDGPAAAKDGSARSSLAAASGVFGGNSSIDSSAGGSAAPNQAALGLRHAHEEAHLAHGHVKPGHLLVDRAGAVKLISLRLACLLDSASDTPVYTRRPAYVGTPDYTAPEQVVGAGITERTDIYSLGCTFYFCLTGQPPFPGGSVAEKLTWHQTRTPPPLPSLRPDMPEGIAALIERMMASR